MRRAAAAREVHRGRGDADGRVRAADEGLCHILCALPLLQPARGGIFKPIRAAAAFPRANESLGVSAGLSDPLCLLLATYR